MLSFLNSASFLRRFHFAATIGWLLLIPITVFTGFKTSILWIGFMSAWANFASHWSAWQSTRVETEMNSTSCPSCSDHTA